mgnify:CR=1 FL=1
MAQPDIDVQEVPESAKDETKLKFVATVERRPDIELPAIDGMEIEVAKAEITDEDINNRLEACVSVLAPSWVWTARPPRATTPTST